MATTALGVVPLADAKRELRVSGTDDDSLITAHIGAAVDYVAGAMGRPLIRETKTYRAMAPMLDEGAIVARLFDLQTVTKVEMWGQSREPRQTADVVVTSFGRTQKSQYGDWWEIFPATAWPSHRKDMGAVVTATCEVTSIPASAKQACLLAVGNLFDGLDLGGSDSLNALIRSAAKNCWVPE